MLSGLWKSGSRPDLPEAVDGIILLGGSVHTEMTADRGQPVLNGAAERITEFVKLARRYPDAQLVFTGGSGFVFSGDLRETDVIAEVLDGLGFDISRILFERDSRNTYENAVFARRCSALPPAGPGSSSRPPPTCRGRSASSARRAGPCWPTRSITAAPAN